MGVIGLNFNPITKYLVMPKVNHFYATFTFISKKNYYDNYMGPYTVNYVLHAT